MLTSVELFWFNPRGALGLCARIENSAAVLDAVCFNALFCRAGVRLRRLRVGELHAWCVVNGNKDNSVVGWSVTLCVPQLSYLSTVR